MNRLILRLVINAAALWAAVRWVPGVGGDTRVETLVPVAIIFGVVNALIRPVLKLLTCPLQIVTLGLFTFVLNALMLWLTSVLAGRLGFDFVVRGFWPALLGSIVISLVSVLLTLFVREEKRR